ncbi:MAG: hypothetical protein ABI865_11755, partial [Nitrosospira sp.]
HGSILSDVGASSKPGAVQIGVGRATFETCQGRYGMPKRFAWPIFMGSYPIIGCNFVVAAGYFSELAPLVFMIGIVWLLMVTAATFVSLLSTEERNA